jgi:glyoxylase-like metal-dependent hydrolase (beta-lactamase superfamily II)
MQVFPHYDKETATVSYVVADCATGACAIIDSVLDYDAKSARTATRSADALIDIVREQDLACEWLLETHVHADHVSAANYLKHKLGGRIGIGAEIVPVERNFAPLLGLPHYAGSKFDHLFHDGERFMIGSLPVTALHTPGHTQACMTFVMGDAAFVGDTLFMPDSGTARCDFPGGSAHALYRSIRRILALPPRTRLYTCHDYAPNGRAAAWETTVAEQREANIHIRDGVSEDDFAAMRDARDKTLAMPALLLPSIQINLRAGELPEPDKHGRRYLKLPLNAL